MLIALLLAAARLGAADEEPPRALEGFKVERLLEVPPAQGSWVAMTFDGQGRLIVSPQEGALRRVDPNKRSIETLDVPVGDAQGLLWAFDSLYVNGKGPSGAGFYRLRD